MLFSGTSPDAPGHRTQGHAMPRTTAFRRRALLLAATLTLGAGATGASAQTAAPACNRSIALANEASRPVQEVFVRDSGTTAWGADLLGEAVLRPGASMVLTTGRTGMIDLMVLTPDGAARILSRFDPCAVRRVTLTANLELRAQ